jgi:Mg2+/Co2+ transporter CorB
MNLLKIKCKIIITIAMTTTAGEAGLQLTTILIATTTTIPASLLKTLSQNFPEDLQLAFSPPLLLSHLLLLLLHHHS